MPLCTPLYLFPQTKTSADDLQSLYAHFLPRMAMHLALEHDDHVDEVYLWLCTGHSLTSLPGPPHIPELEPLHIALACKTKKCRRLLLKWGAKMPVQPARTVSWEWCQTPMDYVRALARREDPNRPLMYIII